MFDKTINTFYKNIIDEAYEIAEDFDYKKARTLYKKNKVHAKMVESLIKETKLSLELVEFNNNINIKNDIELKLEKLEKIKKLNDLILRYDLKTKEGYYMYINDIINNYEVVC